jgi:hypothetical protein
MKGDNRRITVVCCGLKQLVSTLIVENLKKTAASSLVYEKIKSSLYTPRGHKGERRYSAAYS